MCICCAELFQARRRFHGNKNAHLHSRSAAHQCVRCCQRMLDLHARRLFCDGACRSGRATTCSFAAGAPSSGKGSPQWFSDLSEEMRTASTGLMMLDDIDETEEVSCSS